MHSNIEIQDCHKVFRHDQEKVRNPGETIRWVRERLQEVNINILAKTMRIDTGRLDIPVYISLCGDDATRLTGTKKQMGKGASPAQSEASALMELMERFSFFSYIQQHGFPLRPYGEVDSRKVSPEILKRSVHDGTTPSEVCRAFLDGFPMRWAMVHNLTRKEDQWLPIDWFFLINEYNGPAAGNTIEEAILQGLCEVVERHVGSIICHEALHTPLIDPQSLEDPAAIELVEKFRKQGIELFLRDFSLDTGVPTVS
jgi:ribosomal protein S12 methylthiotransferase accessory factor